MSTCVIDTQTLLSNFFRSYYVSCMLGTRTINGSYFSHSITLHDEYSAIDPYMRIIRSRNYTPNWTQRDEPPWHKPDTIIHALSQLSNPAYPFVSGGLSAGYLVFKNIVPVRNFYAHKNRSNLRQVATVAASYSIPLSLHPNELLLSYPLGDNSTVIENWYFEILNTIEYLCYQ